MKRRQEGNFQEQGILTLEWCCWNGFFLKDGYLKCVVLCLVLNGLIWYGWIEALFFMAQHIITLSLVYMFFIDVVEMSLKHVDRGKVYGLEFTCSTLLGSNLYTWNRNIYTLRIKVTIHILIPLFAPNVLWARFYLLYFFVLISDLFII